MHSGTRNTDASYRKLSFWLDTMPDSLEPRPSLQGNAAADVAIIGAGYTGLWTAWYLKQHSPALDIAVVEAEIAGFGASGRNGGWCSAYLSGIEGWLDDPQQRESALRLQRLMFQTVADIGAACQDASIDAQFEQAGHVEIAVLPAQLVRMQREVAYWQSLGLGDAIHELSADETQDRVNMEHAVGGFYMPHCAAVHPARLARGLAERLAERGVRIYEQSPVTLFGPGEVRTREGRLRAKRVLLATEGYTSQLHHYRRKLVPLHSTMVATEPLDASRLEATGLQRRYCFNNLNHIVTYGHLTADRRIAFGCRGSYRYGSRIQHFDPSNSVFERVRNTLTGMFPGLAGVHFTHAWGGCMGVARTLQPSVCFHEPSGIGWAGGFFGNGVAATHLAGRTLADLALQRDTERVHTPWVNPPEVRYLTKRLWEPEPVRWLGIKSRTAWMHWTDWAERRAEPLAGPMNWVLEHVFP